MRCLSLFVVVLGFSLHGPAAWSADAERPQPPGVLPRVPWTTSRVVGSPDPPLPYRARPTFTKLKFENPLYIEREPGTDRLLVVQQNGKILRFTSDPETAEAELFLDVGQETYGLTFHPDYESNGWLYVVSNGPRDSKPKKNRVSRFTVGRDAPWRCDHDSELVVIEWESDGHNGGDLAFGPDGYLYIPAGDGTSDSDTDDTGQDLSNLLATMIRIDVDHPDPGRAYSVPDDNPFLDHEGARPEIWAYGFRNPWRLTFDEKTGHLWVGNIGQDLWEMIHLVRRGENYGWSLYEGSQPFHLNRRAGPTPPVKPTIEHHHSEARSITGGIVYYGPKFPELHGAYLYGDYSTGRVWAVRHDGEKIVWHREIANTSLQILGFGTDRAGEIFLVDYGGGIGRLEPAPQDVPQAKFPLRLSETGLFRSVAGHVPEPALVPYSVNSPLWSDGAHKERLVGLPGRTQIDFTTWRGWNFPDETVLVKTFSLDLEADNPVSRHRIETRLLTRQQGEWVGYSYVWNDEQTDAVLVGKEGLDRVFTIHDPRAPGGVREQTWRYPSRAECMVCHSRAANFVLGLTELQMNKLHDYGDWEENQLARMQRLGLFRVPLSEHENHWRQRYDQSERQVARALTAPWSLADRREPPKMDARVRLVRQALAALLPPPLSRGRAAAAGVGNLVRPHLGPRDSMLLSKAPDQYRRLVDPDDRSESLDARARSYLHANCSQCHVEAGGGNSRMELEFFTPRERTWIFDVPPQHQTFGITDGRIVAPGDPQRSILYQRLTRRGQGQMPPLATSEIDEAAARLIHDWIMQMEPE